MKTRILIAFTAGMLLAGPALADETLAKKYNCLACHQIDKKGVGPAYKEIAKKYKGQAGIEVKLAQKVKKGGAGVWGQIPMPPNAAAPDGDIKKLVEWILTMG